MALDVYLTNACNLRCAHCYHPHHKNEGALSLGEWQGVILQYKSLVEKMRYRPAIVICGGEPLASPFLVPMLEFIKREVPKSAISILTNGTLVNEKLAADLKK